jgi:hypothetical protein
VPSLFAHHGCMVRKQSLHALRGAAKRVHWHP